MGLVARLAWLFVLHLHVLRFFCVDCRAVCMIILSCHPSSCVSHRDCCASGVQKRETISSSMCGRFLCLHSRTLSCPAYSVLHVVCPTCCASRKSHFHWCAVTPWHTVMTAAAEQSCACLQLLMRNHNSVCAFHVQTASPSVWLLVQVQLGHGRSYCFLGRAVAAIWRIAMRYSAHPALAGPLRRWNSACTGCHMLAAHVCVVRSVGCVVHVWYWVCLLVCLVAFSTATFAPSCDVSQGLGSGGGPIGQRTCTMLYEGHLGHFLACA
jgi:hypothetical protein